MGTKDIFIRKASGLRRDLSVRGAIVIALANTAIGVYASYNLSDATLVFPNANYFLWVGILAPAVSMLTMAVCFIAISTLMPRAGGPYVALSRTITPILGFLISWLFMIDMIIWIGVSAGYVATWTLPVAFTGMAAATNNAGLIDLMYTLSEPINSFIIGVVTILFAFSISIFGMKVWARVQAILWLIGMLGVIVGAILLFTTPQATFAARLDNVATSFFGAGPDFSATAVATAKSYGMVWPVTNQIGEGLSAMITTGFTWTIWFSFAATFLAGEIRKIRKSTLYSIAAAAITGIFAQFILAGAIFSAVGQELYSAANLLFNYGAFGAGEWVIGWAAPPYWNFWASIATDNPLLIALIAVSFFCWSVMWIPVGMVVFSRTIMAWSFDGLTPKWLADVSSRFRIPHKALILGTLVSFVYLAIWISYPNSVYQYLVTYLLESTFLLGIGVTCVILPYKLKDLFEASPVRWKIGSIPILSLSGAGLAIIAIARMIIYLTNPGYAFAQTLPMMWTYVIGVVTGLAVFIGFYYYRKSKGLQVNLAYKEIPPE
jgi:amino acid transporter